MYCRECGAQLADDAKFCWKCGKTVPTAANSPAPSVPTEPGNATQKKSGSKKIIISVVAILGLLAAFFVFKSFGSGVATSIGTSKSFSLDKIHKQCNSCEYALNDYLVLLEEGNEFGFNEERLESYSYQLYNDMHHDCSATTMKVENIPYVYRGCLGTYTGQWKGAGPSGQGEFIGTNHFSDDIISYTGEWAYGLPEGEGELYIENIRKTYWNVIYKGQMYAGQRNGTGYIVEYQDSPEGVAYDPRYRIYDQGTFSDDELAVVTRCQEYNAKTGELLGYYDMIGDSKGWVGAVNAWNADELSPEQRAALDAAGSALLLGAIGYIVKETISPTLSYTSDDMNKQMMSDLDNYRKQKEADEQETLARQQAEKESYRNYCADQYDKLHRQDPSDWSLDAQYFKYNMY